MPFFGGSKAASIIHDRIVERLQKEMEYKLEEAIAIKSIIYDMAKKAAKKSKSKDPITGVMKAKWMEAKLDENDWLKTNITPKMIKQRIEKIRAIKAERSAANAHAPAQAAGKKPSKKKKVSAKKKSSKGKTSAR